MTAVDRHLVTVIWLVAVVYATSVVALVELVGR